MKKEKTILLLIFFLFASIITAGSASAKYDIDQNRTTVVGEGYVLGVSNEDDVMLLRILDTDKIKDPEVRHQAYEDANWLANESRLDLEDFREVYGDDEEFFQDKLGRVLSDLRILEKLGMENGENAPNLVRFFTDEYIHKE